MKPYPNQGDPCKTLQSPLADLQLLARDLLEVRELRGSPKGASGLGALGPPRLRGALAPGRVAAEQHALEAAGGSPPSPRLPASRNFLGFLEFPRFLL